MALLLCHLIIAGRLPSVDKAGGSGPRPVIMNLVRLIALALLIWIIYRMIRRAIESRKPRASGELRKLVNCKYCDVQVSEDIAVVKSGDWYCCQEHADLGSGKGT